MRYLCLVYFEEKTMETLSKSESDRCVRESLAYIEELQDSGHLIAAHALQPVRTATSLRLHNSKLSVTDGPFAETKEQLGGYSIIEVKNLDEALSVAARNPLLRGGHSIEVRPIRVGPPQ